jgi:hypothetical protein
MECWSVGVLECWSVGVLECWRGAASACVNSNVRYFCNLASADSTAVDQAAPANGSTCTIATRRSINPERIGRARQKHLWVVRGSRLLHKPAAVEDTPDHTMGWP